MHYFYVTLPKCDKFSCVFLKRLKIKCVCVEKVPKKEQMIKENLSTIQKK